MVDGENGLVGHHAAILVDQERNQEPGCVTIRTLQMVERDASEDPSNRLDVTCIIVRVSRNG